METAIKEIEDIRGILANLPVETVREIRDFAFYLADREKRRKALVERVLKAEQQHDSVLCTSVAEAMQAIYNTPDEDDEA
jgi:hypothetical protein